METITITLEDGTEATWALEPKDTDYVSQLLQEVIGEPVTIKC